MRLIAVLTMPNVGSWNGKWTGSKEKYTKVFLKSNSKKSKEYIGNYYYDFGDGWGANVEIRESIPNERVTNKFCGYEWMLDSILRDKKIKPSSL